MNRPVIVAPGGSYEKAVIASKYGAEDVYIWVPFTSLRMRQNKVKDFSELKRTIDALHQNGSRALLTMNIFPRNSSNIKAWRDCVSSAISVYNGYTRGISCGATLYFSPRSMRPKGSLPKWNYKLLQEVHPRNVNENNIRCYKYK